MQAVPSNAQSPRFDWMFSPRQDLLYFFLPVPFAFLLFASAEYFELGHAMLFALITQEVLGLGAFHQGATWFHFLDKRNREHYFVGVQGFLNFVLAPLALFAFTVAGEVFFAPLTFFIYVCWSLNHAVQQNIGVLLLYQNNKSNEAKVQRNIQAWSQRLPALCFALVFFRRVLLAGTPLSDLAWVPIAICALAGLAYCAAFIVSISRELNSGKYLNLSHLFFWILCIAYLTPFAFLGKDYDDALMIPLVIHWCQYIGINYVVAQRKYEGGRTEALPSRHPLALYAASGFSLVALIAVLTYFQKLHGDAALPGKILRGAILGMGMVHYYLDGFIWRFRDKFPRDAMLPFLVRR